MTRALPVAFALAAAALFVPIPASGSALVTQDPASRPADPQQDDAAATPTALERVAAAHEIWDRVLGAVVRDERVDYLGLRATALADLDRYLDELAAIDPEELPRDDRLAFYIDLYNASMVRAVLDRYRAGWTPAADEFAVFKAEAVRLNGEATSLDHLEHEIVRARFDEPRIHVALVCGAVSCPPILDRAWRGETVDATLEERMRAFLRDRSRNDIRRDEAELSQIFEWFGDDFRSGDRGLADYLRAHGAAQLRPDATIRFRPYDWSLNIAAPQAGRFVELQEGGAHLTTAGGKRRALSEGDVLMVVTEEGDELRVESLDGHASGSVPASSVRPHRPRG
jgi:hypothetical protein